ncbi:Hypothetical protein PSM36_3194 [Proteiniphilum saccharofermentans]|uniref:Uncharacterized protein n=1 Tax=Proteiniphilum saccharofermentans TaxID=1642647 RepID=A0A1R3T0Q0_9BACT|nr:Hypothetical protein PSM36_3194 [Proteiniphilum saccharofermentans]SFS63630.1 hypothetical protein SAMN05216365_11271 [Porphyromonadaceae bacterium NLAE-zl-C104]
MDKNSIKELATSLDADAGDAVRFVPTDSHLYNKSG